ncbi:MAG: TonB-dependent receptor, partial [Bryobacterales bacterium]|nr:TonB-dependent receptor [Bryobacterales bacterium]
ARLNGFVVQNGNGSNFAMAGGRGNNAMWTIDGGNAQNILLGVATLVYDPPVESLEEFNVEISNYKAELGRSGGGYVQMTTKSGTNELHGSLYNFLRNDRLDARNFFASSKPALRYNQFGASAGGPIRKDRTFLFANYEGLRIRRQQTILASVPTRAEIAGDFTGLATVRDPLTGSPFPNNIIPASRLDPVGTAIANLYPQPNVAGARSRNNNFRANQPLRTNTEVAVARVDHNFSLNDRVYGRFLVSETDSFNSPVYPQPGVDPYHTASDNSFYSWSATWQHSFSPTATLESRYSWDRRKANALSGGSDLGLAQRLGIKGTNDRFFPQINIPGLTGFGTGNHERLQVPIRGDHVTSNITTIRGAHTLKFGGEWRRSTNDDRWSGTGGGVFGFNQAATGDALASLLTGWALNGSRAEALLLRTRASAVGFFAQTDWKLTPKLTLNLGLRWDLDAPRRELVDNRQNSFDQFAINPISGTPGLLTWSGRNGRSDYAHNFDKNNFGPRLGFAYRVTDSWVIRGGSGVLYVGQYDQATPIVANIGFGLRTDVVSPDGGRTPAFLLKGGLPPAPAPSNDLLVPGYGAVRPGQNPTSPSSSSSQTAAPSPTSITPTSISNAACLAIPSSRSATSAPSATNSPRPAAAPSTRWTPAASAPVTLRHSARFPSSPTSASSPPPSATPTTTASTSASKNATPAASSSMPTTPGPKPSTTSNPATNSAATPATMPLPTSTTDVPTAAFPVTTSPIASSPALRGNSPSAPPAPSTPATAS